MVQADVRSVVGTLYLDGDTDASSTQDSVNAVQFGTNLTLTAKTWMTLQSTTGGLVGMHELTLRAGAGVAILSDIASVPGSTPLVIDADFESAGDGILRVAAGKTVSTNSSQMTITAWDVDLAGMLDAGSGAIRIHGSKVGLSLIHI